LAMVMTLVVTGVGFLIHIYSVGYMHGDRGFARYFAYLNLFTTAMLILVLADNLVLLFVGWEGVGLCSYLLIGFWYEKPENAAAGKKAFLVNRVGDAGFLLGLFLIVATLGSHGIWTLDVATIQENRALLKDVAWLVCLLLFVGATGKSAQLPLSVWLPDAMAGPTPVSALIHAATMVTAGVYMIARLHCLYALAPAVLAVVAVVGALTALFAAAVASAQMDIKKVLAYSTVSQLGYMFLGLGVGATGAAVFHLVTHAFFKALLFLGAGSVIHGLGGEGHEAHAPLAFMLLATALAAGGLGLAWALYVKWPGLPSLVAWRLGAFYRLVRDKFRVDELYDAAVVRPLFALAEVSATRIDPQLIDGAVNGAGRVVSATSGAWRRFQTGNVQHYALSFLAGALALLGYWVTR